MSQTVEIENIGRKGRNYLVTLSDGGEVLVTRTVLERHSLKIGAVITPDTLGGIKQESDLQRAEEYTLYLLSRSSYSEGRLRAKMVEKGYEKDIINQTLSHLKMRGHIDDDAYARAAAESILRNKPAGRSYIIGYLRKKYIARTLAESVVEELFRDIDEVDIAARLLRSRWGYFAKFELETARRKAYNYLSRRSISYGAAKIAFDRVVKEDD